MKGELVYWYGERQSEKILLGVTRKWEPEQRGNIRERKILIFNGFQMQMLSIG